MYAEKPAKHWILNVETQIYTILKGVEKIVITILTTRPKTSVCKENFCGKKYGNERFIPGFSEH